jgi:hypothetical protein
LARYSDTKGYEADRGRTIWQYRDWVIKSLNEDLRFDQFTIEQLAGDLLPNPSYDQLLATAFHRNTMNNDEGGTSDEEYRTEAVIDRVNTTFDVFQSTTMSCVQCHDHPYDPSSKKNTISCSLFSTTLEMKTSWMNLQPPLLFRGKQTKYGIRFSVDFKVRGFKNT